MEHEKAYSPSSWSKRFDSTELLSYFNELAVKVTNECRKKIACKLDVPYGSTDNTKYDIYGINLSNDVPVFIFIHGGYWQECNKQYAGFHIETLVSKGIKVFNIGYDLCPTVTLSDIVAEIKLAIEKIVKSCYAQGTKTIWIGGHSAGAHLAASILYDQEWQSEMADNNCLMLIKGIVLVGGIYSLEPLLTTTYNNPLKLTQKEVKTLSFNHVNIKTPILLNNIKALVVVGECDAPKFIEESKNYSKKLIDLVDQVEFILYRNNTDHFDIMEKLMDPTNDLSKTIITNILQ